MKRVEFERIVDAALEELPTGILGRVDNLVVVVEDSSDRDPDLLGLYEGIPLKDRGDYSGAFPDRITIYRLPHLALGLPPDALRAEIRRTVLHEIAHHLGIDDVRLSDLGWD